MSWSNYSDSASKLPVLSYFRQRYRLHFGTWPFSGALSALASLKYHSEPPLLSPLPLLLLWLMSGAWLLWRVTSPGACQEQKD